MIARSESTVTLLAGLTLLGQLVGYNYFSGLFYSTLAVPTNDVPWRLAFTRPLWLEEWRWHDGGRYTWLRGRPSHAVYCGSRHDARIDRCAINCLVEVGATAEQEKGRSCDTGILSTRPQYAGIYGSWRPELEAPLQRPSDTGPGSVSRAWMRFLNTWRQGRIYPSMSAQTLSTNWRWLNVQPQTTRRRRPPSRSSRASSVACGCRACACYIDPPPPAPQK